MRDGKVKEFYMKANSLMKIKRANPVVTKVQREDEHGDMQVFDDRIAADGEIAKYFTKICKRPEFRRSAPADVDFNVGIDEPMKIDSSSSADIPPFTREEVMEAMKSSNFNKGLGPDCFDGNLLKNNQQLNDKVTTEITIALNNANIPQYLRVGRLVPLQKTQTKGPVRLDDIRPIVVRSHISKIMEKALLTKIKASCEHVISSKIY